MICSIERLLMCLVRFLSCSLYYSEICCQWLDESLCLQYAPGCFLLAYLLVTNIFYANHFLYIFLFSLFLFLLLLFLFLLLSFLLLLLLLGLLWRNLDDGDYLSRLSLFAAVYIFNTVWIVETIPSLHEEKLIFYRERDSKATTTLASWLTIGVQLACLAALFDLLFIIPIYFISGLRAGSNYFVIFYLAVYLNMLANLYIMHFVAGITPNPMIHTIIFPGIIVPLQVMTCTNYLLLATPNWYKLFATTTQTMTSGYAVMISTLDDWFSWGVTLNPLFWMFDILFQNEMKNNPDAISDFNALQSEYGWEYSISEAMCYLILICLVHKFLSYFAFRFINHSSS